MMPEIRQEAWWGNPVGEFRWPFELAKLIRSGVYTGDGVPHGDGSTVLVIPGLATNDMSTAVLRHWLRIIGYRPVASGVTLNIDCSDRILRRVERSLVAAADRAGDTVAIVGHSRGGQLGRALAARRPELVSQLVTLGAGLNDPFAVSIPLGIVVDSLRRYHQAVTDRDGRRGCLTNVCTCEYGRSFRARWPASVALTSIRARDDGVVPAAACLVSGAHNVEVPGTHTGLVFNAHAYRAIARVLAEG